MLIIQIICVGIAVSPSLLQIDSHIDYKAFSSGEQRKVSGVVCITLASEPLEIENI